MADLKHGTNVLMVGMISWLSVITVVSIVVFVVIYKRLGRDDDDGESAADDAESVITEKNVRTKVDKEKTSVVDFRFFDARYMHNNGKCAQADDSRVSGGERRKLPVISTIDVESLDTDTRDVTVN